MPSVANNVLKKSRVASATTTDGDVPFNFVNPCSSMNAAIVASILSQ